MARKRSHKDKREGGGFVPLSFAVLRSASYAKLSSHAVKLLNDLLAQYNGRNNGDLCMAWKLMKERGWRSEETLNKAKRELLAGDWIEVSRRGGLHKPSLYAFTFFAVDECGGKLDIASTHSPKSTWRLHEPMPKIASSTTPNVVASL